MRINRLGFAGAVKIADGEPRFGGRAVAYLAVAEVNAKIAGICWLAVGAMFYAVMRRRSIGPPSLL